MTDTKHTPGPWVVTHDAELDAARLVVSKDGVLIADA